MDYILVFLICYVDLPPVMPPYLVTYNHWKLQWTSLHIYSELHCLWVCNISNCFVVVINVGFPIGGQARCPYSGTNRLSESAGQMWCPYWGTNRMPLLRDKQVVSFEGQKLLENRLSHLRNKRGVFIEGQASYQFELFAWVAYPKGPGFESKRWLDHAL